MQKEEMIKRKREEGLSGIPAAGRGSRSDLTARMCPSAGEVGLHSCTVSDNAGASGKP